MTTNDLTLMGVATMCINVVVSCDPGVQVRQSTQLLVTRTDSGEGVADAVVQAVSKETFEITGLTFAIKQADSLRNPRFPLGSRSLVR